MQNVERYRNFWCRRGGTLEAAQRRVDVLHNSLRNPVLTPPLTSSFDAQWAEGIDTATLQTLLDRELHNDTMWDLCKHLCSHRPTGPMHWIMYVNGLFVAATRRYMDAVDRGQDRDDRAAAMLVLNAHLVRCRRLVVLPGNILQRFHRSVQVKMQELMQVEGCVDAFLCFAAYFPDLVTADVHPVLATDTPVYQKTDWNLFRTDPTWAPLFDRVGGLAQHMPRPDDHGV